MTQINWQEIIRKPLKLTFAKVDVYGGQILSTPFGYVYLYRNKESIVGLTLSSQKGTLKDYCPWSTIGDIPETDCVSLLQEPVIAITIWGTSFQQQVWQGMANIPVHGLWSYKTLAEHIGFSGRHSRAVGGAVGANPVSVLIPCHRVLASDGSIGGYRWSVEIKKAILDFEKKNKG